VLGCNNYEVIDLGVMVPADRILAAVRESGADLLGLSGLITPSLEEMAHVARELEREGFTVPLLIGGATTSRAHTAVKIAPGYGAPVVHVEDASRAVGVVGRLRSAEQRAAFEAENRREQERLRHEHLGRRVERRLLDLEEARRRRTPIDWSTYDPPQPSFLGVRAIDPLPLRDVVPYVDWTPFFAVWELRGTYPRIFENPDWGARAREVFEDGRAMLERLVDEGSLCARASYGFFPAAAVGDDVEIYADESRHGILGTLHTLRQQTERGSDEPNRALADFVAPRQSERPDWLGVFAVTAGIGVEDLVRRHEGEHDDYGGIMVRALADRLAEAATEWLHRRAREEWGFGRDEDISIADLLKERFRGIRPAPGYPACPDHTEKRLLFDLLGGEAAVGIRLTETYAMQPAASVCGFYFSHPASRYFALGPIGRDQVLDYHRRKGMDLQAVERWLSPHLGYDPAGA
jgi:5-methyltetrahydrofolate--homocysteine methyltransferase